TVNLRAIHSVQNVNALKEGERLTFGKVGLTVVYGDNGSGKSGYVRILKQICRARTPKGDTILPNIYATTTVPPNAVIDFSANGQNKSAKWATGKAEDPLLSSISVFDCQTANVYVDGKNDVAYTPFPMKVLERLADTCREIRKHVEAEILELERQTPTLRSLARTGQRHHRLHPDNGSSPKNDPSGNRSTEHASRDRRLWRTRCAVLGGAYRGPALLVLHQVAGGGKGSDRR
ncbi:MAG: hypothetical protein IIC96_02740, partial [Chloroflexi bacterium]|nr:hypothetical protein [Chloroflexota bacterium]